MKCSHTQPSLFPVWRGDTVMVTDEDFKNYITEEWLWRLTLWLKIMWLHGRLVRERVLASRVAQGMQYLLKSLGKWIALGFPHTTFVRALTGAMELCQINSTFNGKGYFDCSWIGVLWLMPLNCRTEVNLNHTMSI